MRLSLRFLLPLVAALALLAYIVVPQVDALTLRWFVRDLDSRAQLAADPLAGQLAELIPQKANARITALLNGVTQNERLYAIAYCDAEDRVAYRSANLPPAIGCTAAPGEERVGASTGDVAGSIVKLPKGSLHVARIPVRTDEGGLAKLVMVSDMSFIESRSEDTRKYTILLFLVLAIVTSLVTVLVAHLSWRGWIAGVRAMLRGRRRPAPVLEHRRPAGDVGGATRRRGRLRSRAAAADVGPAQHPAGGRRGSPPARQRGRRRRVDARAPAPPAQGTPVRTTRSSSCPTASRTSTSTRSAASRCSARRAVS